MAKVSYNPQTSQQFAQMIARLLPHQQNIPSFDQSGLYDQNAANAQYDAEFKPYYQGQSDTLDAQKTAAQASLHRSLGYLGDSSDLQTHSAQAQAATQGAQLELERRKNLMAQSGTAAQLGQTGSGVNERDTGVINEDINNEQHQVQNVLQQQTQSAKQYQDYATGAYNQEYNAQYGDQATSAYNQNKQNISDQQITGRSTYQDQLRNESYQRYLQRYQNQPKY